MGYIRLSSNNCLNQPCSLACGVHSCSLYNLSIRLLTIEMPRCKVVYAFLLTTFVCLVESLRQLMKSNQLTEVCNFSPCHECLLFHPTKYNLGQFLTVLSQVCINLDDCVHTISVTLWNFSWLVMSHHVQYLFITPALPKVLQCGRTDPNCSKIIWPLIVLSVACINIYNNNRVIWGSVLCSHLYTFSMWPFVCIHSINNHTTDLGGGHPSP